MMRVKTPRLQVSINVSASRNVAVGRLSSFMSGGTIALAGVSSFRHWPEI